MKRITLFFALVFTSAFALSLFARESNQSAAPSSQSVSSSTMSNDGELTQQLQSKFGRDPAFANVQVSVNSGTAMITGSVPAKNDKKRAKEMAKSIAGVKHVKEQLTVNPSAGNSNDGSKSNNPTDASLSSGSNSTPGNANSASSSSDTTAASAAGTQNSTNPPNAQTNSTSSNPNSQTSSSVTASSSSSAAAASPATGDNASSLPQNAGSAANENNVAGQGPVNGQSASSAGGNTGSARTPATASQPTVGSGAIGANASGAPSTPTPSGAGEAGISINDTATLQNQIQNALQNEPTLRNDNVNVTVTDSTIELSGNVQNSKEKQTARRIASSFAGNRRVSDRITLSGKGSAASPSSSNGLGGSPATNTNQNPNSNPNSQNPSASNPKANGDASANPR